MRYGIAKYGSFKYGSGPTIDNLLWGLIVTGTVMAILLEKMKHRMLSLFEAYVEEITL